MNWRLDDLFFRRAMKQLKWLSTLLAASGVAWCFLIGWWIWTTPIPYGVERIEYRSFSEVSGLGIVPLAVPTVLAGLSAWAAWCRKTFSLAALTLGFWGFCLLTGFSTGSAYVPITLALLAATLMSLADTVVARRHKAAV